MERAACRGAAPIRSEDEPNPPDKFFPGISNQPEEAILKFCFRCPVRDECEDYANRIDAKSGVWGGRYRIQERKKDTDDPDLD